MKHRVRGFSLLEVIAATLLLAIAFSALLKVAGGSIALTRNADDHSQAALWARSLLDTVDITTPLRAGSSEGRFDDHYRWRLVVTPWTAPRAQVPAQLATPELAANPMRMVKLDLDVYWGTRLRERSAHFSTLRLLGPPTTATP
ncbi:type IV pilus modification PilV family protein [Dyella jiangningensis]|uniref:Prepilin-type cleavage/methylation domain-containing protein n=1 Tax=Dyella jiangningensis TaxID=1379159 RepID=A0A328P2I9_9GAMM|nr:prepilin-type N-terminal cleavage/methylation domain-containing protein [Dyella jiangningensis]RAO74872.1 prepilin-type cleavage/methylation domain-containing protein [Dyella jiangningensis]